MKKKVETLTIDQVEKLGNTAIFFAQNIYELNKTKLLKLVYLSEELFVKKHASPFLGLPFQAWQFGPVQKELYFNLDPNLINSDSDDRPSILADYIAMSKKANGNYIVKPRKNFSDDNFSDDEMSTISHIADTYKNHDAKQLVFITHKGTSLWYKTIIKENGLLERFEKKIQSTSDITLDFADLLESESAKEFYYSQLDLLEYSNSLKM